MDVFSLAKPILHALSPEAAHTLAIKALKHRLLPEPDTREYDALHTTLWGKLFLNPVGMAAGFDKNAEVIDALAAQGFGFVEVGTVTPLPQSGNPKPRIFRLTQDEAVINRLGFNNEGIDYFCSHFSAHTTKRVVGANIGKNKSTEDTSSDYIALLKRVYDMADYVTVNISSPNTEGLRKLQERAQLEELVKSLMTTRATLAGDKTPKPLLIKIAPDNSQEALEDITGIALQYGVDGLIVSNTTVSRPETLQSVVRFEQGGLSGKPLFTLSTETLKTVYRLSGGKIPLIGVGGIASGDDAYAKIRAGASLVQLYTALVYEGFGLVESMKSTLVKCLERDGFSHISEAIGVDAAS